MKRRFANLNAQLPDMYRSAFAAPPTAELAPSLMALCVDLLRKRHCTLPFGELTAQEQKLVLHALAIETLPSWMARYAALRLPKADRALMAQLRHIHASRPDKPKEHFGAIRQQQRLREATRSKA